MIDSVTGYSVWSYITALVVTSLLIWILSPLAVRIGLVDHPGGRKSHVGRIPLVGGVAMFFGFAFAALMINTSLSGLRGLFAGGALLVIIGLLDDFRELPSWTRFIAQGFAAMLMILTGEIIVKNLGALITNESITLGILAIPFTVMATIGVINAINMSDGLDGLGGGLSLIALGFMAYIAARAERLLETEILLLLCCVVGAFLIFNFPILRRRALVFMGDAGSMFLGFVISWFAISLSQGENPAMHPVTALWIIALPLLDTVAIMVRRVLKGQSPFLADREHLHHIFLVAGYSSRFAVTVILLVAFFLATIGVVADRVGVQENFMFLIFTVLFFCYFWSMKRAWRLMKWITLHPAGDSV